MNIGVIGTGMMGLAFAKRWIAAGHELMVGSRDPVKAEAAAKELGCRFGDFETAASFGDVVLLAVNWHGVEDALGLIGNVDGKIVIDCGNPIHHDEHYETAALPDGLSLAETIARALPRSHVVKAFNTNYKEVYEYDDPVIEGVRVNTFVAADSTQARETVMRLARDAGLNPVDCGGLRKSHHLESLASLIVFLGFGHQKLGPHIAFNLLRDPDPASRDTRRAQWLRTPASGAAR